MSSESERDTHSTAASDFETEIGVLSHENEKWENLGNGAGEDVCITLKDGAGRSRARMSLIKLFEDASRRARNGVDKFLFPFKFQFFARLSEYTRKPG